MPDENDPAKNKPEEEEQENTKPADELTEEDLEDIAGGVKVQVHDIIITKPVDKSSPRL
jgi:type VI protein secretion system component Hcp